MANDMARVIVVGGGVFGITGALSLRARGHEVVVLDPGPLPHPLAASTDVSKVVRMDYGADDAYAAQMERALERWRDWNRRWPSPLFHETGVTFLTRRPMEPGGFEHDSMAALTRRGHRLERLDAATIRARFPAWSTGRYVDGYFNPAGGWVESAAVIVRLVDAARAAGIVVRESFAIATLAERGSRVVGVVGAQGERVLGDVVVVAAGSWTPHLLPELAGALRSVGQPIFHLRPADRAPFEAVRFPVFGADLARTGYYGFPVNAAGVVKIANHGLGRAMHPESPARAVTADEVGALRAFLADTFPALVDAPLVYSRTCLYCDTRDEHFWIARDPGREGLVVATGGSGHAFKFAPLLGDWIADAVEGVESAAAARFRWRPELLDARGEEAARRHE